MNINRALKLLKGYSVCGNCGSEFIGDGEGTLEINDNIFKRTCKCGWEIEVREDTNDN